MSHKLIHKVERFEMMATMTSNDRRVYTQVLCQMFHCLGRTKTTSWTFAPLAFRDERFDSEVVSLLFGSVLVGLHATRAGSHRIVQEPIAETDWLLGSLRQVPEAIRGFPVWAGNAAR
jgi:hypothetical protein